MRVILTKKAEGRGYSVEAGLADGKQHFDHHREHSDNPGPCRDERIPVVSSNDIVEISHIDADTYVGLLRMDGRELPKVDFDLMERIDLNSSSVCSDKFNETLLYMVGVNQIARDLKFPFPKDEPQDVSEVIESMMRNDANEIVRIGHEANEKSEATYRNCRKVLSDSGKVGYWEVGASDPFDPSRPYEDGVKVVVVYRQHYKSVSIYCDPKSDYAFGGKTVAGIEFAGHPKAAGSPRGVEFSNKDGRRVFQDLAEIC